MLQILTGFPDDVMAVQASGELTRADYRGVLVPAAEAMLARHKPLRLFYEIGPGFTGMEAGAMWEDAKLGLNHWRDFSRIAIVTDVAWIAHSAKLFAPLIPADVQVFALAERDAGRRWILDQAASAA